jgi:hypothetical protein
MIANERDANKSRFKAVPGPGVKADGIKERRHYAAPGLKRYGAVGDLTQKAGTLTDQSVTHPTRPR